MPPWLARSAAVAGRLLVLALLVWLLAAFAVRLTFLVVAVLVAVLVAGALAPLVQWAAGRGAPRWAAAGGAVLLLLLVLAGAGLLLGVTIAEQLPRLRESFGQVAAQVSERFGVEVPGSGGGGSSGAGGLLGPAQTLLEVLGGTVLALVLAYLFLHGGPDMWQWLLGKFGGRVRDDVDAAGRAAWTTVGAYVRGLTIVAVFDAVFIGAGLLLLGVPLALTLAALQFLASYVPTVGAIVAAALAVVVAYADGGAPVGVGVLVLVVVVQQVGNDLVEPFVMTNRLPINATVVLVAVTAGGLLWGVAGALLFVPLAAATAAAGHEAWTRHGSRPIAGA